MLKDSKNFPEDGREGNQRRAHPDGDVAVAVDGERPGREDARPDDGCTVDDGADAVGAVDVGDGVADADVGDVIGV